MPKPFEEEYEDVLQNIEVTILQTHGNQPEMTDWNVDRVLEALTRTYQEEQAGRSSARPSHLTSAVEIELYQSLKEVCDWRLGKAELESKAKSAKSPKLEAPPKPDPKTPDEIIACLKRVRQSIKRWGKTGGRRGYLDFITEYVR